MNFTPKTEEEAQQAGLLEPGEYDFEIADAQNKLSKASNDMIELKIQVFDSEGNGRIIFDYLLESMPLKLRHAAYACGLGEYYESGHLNSANFIGKVGRCKLRIQKDKTGAYPDKNTIADYMLLPPAEPVMATAAAVLSGDTIPF